jgi:hypothetical protein
MNHRGFRAREWVSKVRQLDPEIDQASLFVQQCMQMIRTRTGEKREEWLEEVGSSSLVELHHAREECF